MIEVKPITYNDTKPFILNIHYARRMPCIQHAFGLFKDYNLIGVVTYGQPASPALCKGVAGEENRKNILELNRLVILPEYNREKLCKYINIQKFKTFTTKKIYSFICRCWWLGTHRLCVSSD